MEDPVAQLELLVLLRPLAELTSDISWKCSLHREFVNIYQYHNCNLYIAVVDVPQGTLTTKSSTFFFVTSTIPNTIADLSPCSFPPLVEKFLAQWYRTSIVKFYSVPIEGWHRSVE